MTFLLRVNDINTNDTYGTIEFSMDAKEWLPTKIIDKYGNPTCVHYKDLHNTLKDMGHWVVFVPKHVFEGKPVVFTIILPKVNYTYAFTPEKEIIEDNIMCVDGGEKYLYLARLVWHFLYTPH